MVSNRDIYIAANMLLKYKGEKAQEYVMNKFTQLLHADDLDGASVWFAIGEALNRLKKMTGTIH